MELKTGDILICRGKGELSKIIKKVTKSDWSHTAQILIINKIAYVIDAQKEGVLLRKFEFWLHEFEYKYEVYRDPFPISELYYIDNALQYSGLNYDFKGLGSGLLRTLLCYKEMPNKYRNNGKFWCSEYTMKLQGVEDPEEYSPDRVRNYLIQNNFELIGSNY
jgi:hypothetical protein